MAENKGTAQTRAKNKYAKKAYDDLRIQVKKGKKQIISALAEKQGISINGYTKQALQAKIKADTGEDIEL